MGVLYSNKKSMAMSPCDKCLENNWGYEMLDDKTILAECQNCGYEINFAPQKRKKLSPIKTGICKCEGKLYLRESKFKANKLKKAYYYTHTWRCSKCKKRYLDEKYKIINDKLKQKYNIIQMIRDL